MQHRLADELPVNLDAFGSFSDGEAVAAAMTLDYIRATQAGTAGPNHGSLITDKYISRIGL